MMPLKKSGLLLLILLLFGGIGKIALFVVVQSEEPARMLSPDSPGYVNAARALLTIGRFAESPERPDTPQIVRTPGYPLLITGIFGLFGERYAPLLLCQILLSLATILLVYHIAALLWNTKSALLAALFCSLDLPSVILSQRVLTETLFTFVVSGALVIFALMRKYPRHLEASACCLGTLLAFAALVRPIAYYLIVPVLPVFTVMLRYSLQIGWKRTGSAVVALLLPCLLLIGGWQYRNYRLTGKAEFSYIQGANFLFYRCAGVIAERDHISVEQARYNLGFNRYAELHPETQGWSVAQLDRRWKREGIDIIRRHPLLLIKSQFRGALRLLFGPGERLILDYIGLDYAGAAPGKAFFQMPLSVYFRTWVVERSASVFLIIFAGSYLIVLYACITFSLRHVITSPNKWWGAHLAFWLIILYFIATSAGPGAYARFRIPLVPLFSLYAGHGLSLFLKKTFARIDVS